MCKKILDEAEPIQKPGKLRLNVLMAELNGPVKQQNPHGRIPGRIGSVRAYAFLQFFRHFETVKRFYMNG